MAHAQDDVGERSNLEEFHDRAPDSRPVGPTWSDSPSVSAFYVLPLLERLRRDGVPVDHILAARGLLERSLEEASARIPLDTASHLLRDVRAKTSGIDLGLLLAESLRVTSFGSLGFVVLTAPTLGEALDVAERLAPRTSDLVRLSIETSEEGMAMLVVDERADLGDVREVVVTAALVGIWRVACQLAGRQLEAVAEFAFADPQAPQQSLVPLRTRFRQRRHQLVFDRSLLERMITTAHPLAHALALAQCKTRGGSNAGFDFSSRVRSMIPGDGGEVRSQEDVAARLGLSTRSLKRYLAAQGTKFSELTQEHKRELAETLLRSPELSTGQIAVRLGFSTVSNFTRAFNRWTGQTPSTFRRSARAVEWRHAP